MKENEKIHISVKLSKFAIFLQNLMHFSHTGNGHYKRYMVLPILRECINRTENVAVVGF